MLRLVRLCRTLRILRRIRLVHGFQRYARNSAEYDVACIRVKMAWAIENAESLNRPRCSHAYNSTPQAAASRFGEGWGKQVAVKQSYLWLWV